MIIKYIDWIKNAYVALIRTAYGDNATPEIYRYNPDVKQNKIAIYRGFPRRIELYPCIIIEASASDASISQLGEEELKEIRDDQGNLLKVQYFGGLTIPVDLTIKARTVTDRDRISDLTLIYIRYLFRNKFAEYGFAHTKITLGADEQEEVEGEPVFTRTITVNHYTEFQAEIDSSLFTTIQNINLELLIQDLETNP